MLTLYSTTQAFELIAIKQLHKHGVNLDLHNIIRNLFMFAKYE